MISRWTLCYLVISRFYSSRIIVKFIFIRICTSQNLERWVLAPYLHTNQRTAVIVWPSSGRFRLTQPQAVSYKGQLTDSKDEEHEFRGVRRAWLGGPADQLPPLETGASHSSFLNLRFLTCKIKILLLTLQEWVRTKLALVQYLSQS